KVHRLWRLGSAIYVHAGATAAFAAWLVFALGYLAAQRRRLPRLFVAALGLGALLGVQMAIGETQYRTHLPWWLVLIHVTLALVEGMTRRIDWPENAFYHARPEGLERDAVLLLGVEPNLRWRAFSSLIVDFAQELGIELVISLGALLADVPHTRPAPVTGSASDPELVERLGLSASRYEAPTGIVGVLHD